MTLLQKYEPELNRMTRIVSTIFDIDVAVFDLKSRLISCTDGYLKQKGKTVHAPSIEEVMAHGNVLVNKPGHMKSCIGCRFKGQCPSTIEILKSISLEDSAIGAVTFTSFSKQGHERITRDTEVYTYAVDSFSEWVTDTVLNKEQKRLFDTNARMLQCTLDLSRSAVFTVNSTGAIVQCNSLTLELFSFCDLYTRSIYHILPEPIVDKILEGHPLVDIRVRIDDSQAFVSSVPVNGREIFDGAVIYIRLEKNLQEYSLKKKLPGSNITLESIKGQSQGVRRIRKQAEKIADSLSTVLITGETGTGKGLLAKAIHSTGKRRNAPFVSVNCASIPETLFESELFGYEEGAFSGAQKGGKPGRFELAEGGTLFLDEIGEMPLHLQVKLLNVLQDYSLQRVGGVTQVPIDVRIIAATNQDIERLVQTGKFRSDLFYRLNVIPIDIPPLCTRKDDIEILAKQFLEEYSQKLNKKIDGISDEMISLLGCHDWPGNIRELQNIIEYCVNMTEDKILTTRSLPERFVTVQTKTAVPHAEVRPDLANAELATIISTLDRHGWSVKGKTSAAKELGIGIRTLYRRLKQLEAPASN
ncbi:ATPase AAA [Desulfomarina profundi]|uniref:ATPase AAA n=1 Tax=Desulfomarina profundi TaxID=2772557 RepID=A0A8D5JPQ2_9BACT|nr:sigma 54-interacting transcriptional regulator [Desulfomarina profundi]BCL61490.1 ATPase AAA [Desulfomarina profundi]